MLTPVQRVALEGEIAIMPATVPPATCSAWLALVEGAYRRSDAGPDFVPESSSFRLRAVANLSVIDIWSTLSSHVREFCATILGSRLVIDADQCWVRRQFPPKSAPQRHRPHSWHQDGALGFDFGAAAVADEASLRMVTCWIALSPCGVDAPGLELVADRVDHLLAPAELTDRAIDQRWPAPQRTRPVLEAGDVLVFGGDVLHRTYVSPAMSETRTSIELRCLRADAIPNRIAGDEFVAVPTRSSQVDAGIGMGRYGPFRAQRWVAAPEFDHWQGVRTPGPRTRPRGIISRP